MAPPWKSAQRTNGTVNDMLPDDLSKIEITDLAGVERAMIEGDKIFGEVYPLWRGHANFEWKLQPEVFRREYAEASLIRYFMVQAESRHPRCPAPTDRFAWLSLARHYGLPTRLMDWSNSPLVALYFAAHDDTKDGCIWALDHGRMNLQMLQAQRFSAADDPEVNQIVEVAFDVDTSARVAKTATLAQKALAVGPREIDYRMLVQQGAFTIHADATDLADVKYDSMAKPTPWRRAFRIPKADKPHLREMLTALGIRKSTLFPDLAALAEELKEYVYGPPPI
jgi:hypothetical protein